MSLNANPVPRWRDLDPNRTRSSPPRALVWSALASQLKNDLEHDGESDEADALWLAELYKQRFGLNSLLRQIEIAVPDRLLDPGEAHRALFEVPWQTILTTNYDTLIQKAHAKYKIPTRLKISETDIDLVRSSNREEDLELIHLHGVLTRPETIVLSLEDYRRYPTTHAGMLAKARQLFLQHPVLLIGFSATDPNFVQWSGWVSDFAGAVRNPWINLVVGRQPGVARRSYWKGALDFIGVQPQHLPKLISTIGDYFRPVDSHRQYIYIKSRIESTASIKELASSLPIWLEQQGHELPTASELYNRQQLINLTTHRALKIAFPAEFEATQASAPQNQQVVLGKIRQAFGLSWPSFLLSIAIHHGAFFGGEGFSIDLLRELESIPQDAPTHIVRNLKLQLLSHIAEHDNSRDIIATAHDLLGDNWSQEEKGQIEDLDWQVRFRTGARLPHSSDESSAQALRRAGFFSALDCQFDRSVRKYIRAAQLSRDEGEPEAIEWLTINSALNALIGIRGQEREELSVEKDELERRKDWIERNLPSHISWIRSQETEAFEEVTTSLRKRAWHPVRSPASTGTADRITLELQHWMESRWIHPITIGRIAEINGQLQWNNLQTLEATRTLARYGSESLQNWIRLETQRLGRGPIEKPLIQLLLEDGRWPGEWISRAEALSYVIPEFTDAQLVQLGEWLEAARKRVQDSIKLFRSDSLTSTSAGLESIIRSQIVRWQISKIAIFEADFGKWLETVHTSHSFQQFTQELRTLPWKKWITHGGLTQNSIDDTVHRLLESWIAHGKNNAFTLEYICGLIIEIFSSAGRAAFPLESRALPLVEKMLKDFSLGSGSESTVAHLQAHLFRQSKSTISAIAAEILQKLFVQGWDSAPERLISALAAVTPFLDSRQLAVTASKLNHRLRQSGAQRSPIDGRTVALIAVKAIPVTAEAEREQWYSLLEVCLSASPNSAETVARLSTAEIEPVWPLLRDAISILLSDTSGGETSRAMTGLRTIGSLLENTSLPVSEQWRAHIELLVRSPLVSVAVRACDTLALLVEKDRMTNASPDAWSTWVYSLLEATKDGRAYVVGAAGRALVIGLPALSASTLSQHKARAEDAIAKVRSDDRVGVQAALMRH
ncbi:SIR2 family protein [Corallococcus sp. AB049A]|uniref:SIR2 family NAD-dependent protein deacylase n=1 Tax=Corallococcus sp. AB049A TaxID=2316721 RepID=UPI0013151769|nr:SIR2 family protein [Corallococcus sp. AB049A]